MTIENKFAKSPVKSKYSLAIIKCPVDEIGKNSVNPSIIPKIIAFKII